MADPTEEQFVEAVREVERREKVLMEATVYRVVRRLKDMVEAVENPEVELQPPWEEHGEPELSYNPHTRETVASVSIDFGCRVVQAYVLRDAFGEWTADWYAVEG
ncbi:MAG: hypothetical protein IRZ06_12150 [Nevskia sp.]|nr:hypothetical protein [Nevskia sp.]